MTPDLCIDIGNTRTKWYALLPDGVPVFFASTQPDPAGWEADLRSVAGYLNQFPRFAAGYRWAVAGVNPERIEQFLGWIRGRGDQFIHISGAEQLPMLVDVLEPGKVGIDRLLGGLAAKQRKPAGQAAVVVDAGTAVTVNLISADGVFRGGAIAPGLATLRRALRQQTAKLPLVDESFKNSPEFQAGWPGRSTEAAIYFGTRDLFIGGVGRLIEQAARTIHSSYQLLFTGGDGQLLCDHLGEDRGSYDPCLTVEGLRIAAESLSV